jgi:adenosylcobinamide amidohydrolase
MQPDVVFYSRFHKQIRTNSATANVSLSTLKQIENADSHSKLGELIAKAVYAGVQEAVYKTLIF